MDTIKELELDGVKVSRKWVRGHQDEKTKHSELLIEAQMNCKVDTEAFQCQQEAGATRNKVFGLGSDSAQLHMNGKTTNSKSKSNVRCTASRQPNS